MSENEKTPKNDDDDDELFEKTWENWASRRRCESAHRKEHMTKFKEYGDE